jgi:hypothetical protein
VTKQKSSIIEKVFFCVAASIPLLLPSTIFAKILLDDQFTANPVSPAIWHIPTWTSPGDGTFVGQTQFRCSQNSPLPETVNGNAIIKVDSYNPTALPELPSFYGTDLISNQLFPLGTGIHIKVRAKMATSMPGTVAGIFLYALKPGSTTIHDEIDFELLTTSSHVSQITLQIKSAPDQISSNGMERATR